MPTSSYIDTFSPMCDSIDCTEDAQYERKITVRDMLNQPYTFTAFFCEKHKDEARTLWDDRLTRKYLQSYPIDFEVAATSE